MKVISGMIVGILFMLFYMTKFKFIILVESTWIGGLNPPRDWNSCYDDKFF